MALEEEEVLKEFREYLERYDNVAGADSDFGSFVKHNGRLVKKMRFEEFAPAYREYMEIAKTYFESCDRGDTINDIVVRMLRDRATTLMKVPPV